MKTKVEPAVLKHVSFSEAPSQTSSADSSAPQASVNQVETDIKKMNIKDPGEGSSVPRHLNERPTNQDPCESGYFLKTSERCKKAPYRGLLNQGATCFLNAALQVLFMTQEFRDRVLRAPRSTSERLESALKKLFEELSHQDPDAPSVSTKGVIQALGIERVYEQQDAVEYFLDILEKVGFNLAEVFRGTMRNLRRCSRNHESYDDSDFKSIQISLNTRDGPYTLENGVESYFASTKLVGDDQMYCEECDEKSDTIWSCEISEYPAVLALHLKRFVYDYCSNRFVKNHCPMDVPLQLRLQKQEYWLYAVVNHRGSRYGGHYTADILAPEDNKWFCFDDSRVTETNESKLKGSREAYLLLYQKTSSVERVEDVEEAQMKSEAETSRAEERGGAHDKKDLKDWMCFSVSAVTRRLRILVLSRTESHKNTVEEMILRHAGFSSQPQLYCDESLKDSLEVCRPGPHVILWVTPLEMNQKDIQAFKKVYRFLGRTARRYIMIVFISEGRPSESSKNTTRKYRPIKNSLVLDISAHLSDQAKNLFYKLKKTAYKNPRMPYYDNKPRKVRHKKTKKKKHERERARKSKLRSNHGERERRKQS
ncbi:ubiquitin carboxyl-terminal hydrolase 21-like isoform X5 [Puntigrus tetrazona]|uniref:ubiquitin carboxyl-terminal hydrolase 21-like isoform X5 n=1 Tax=Puntigrus tetrazona TaxID=1606681 RepID=UPI001C8AC704|nr:ubiquitin carboxyl-terminal hydrolase 21-like isoform X5 [Puntigrus tetrazona]